MKARCQCGQLSVDLPDMTPAVVACHCQFCQRRSGSPFGVLAYYPADLLRIEGQAVGFERPADSGGSLESFFCGVCGSTVYARASKHPTMLGVAVGAVADPAFQPPMRSVWETKMHPWVSLPEGVQHFPEGRPS
jgi:hypothetical protein